MPRVFPAMVGLLMAVGGCTTERETSPSRTATEQLLISAAADRAAQSLALQIPRGAKVFVDDAYFEGTDSKYAIGALRERLLTQGAHLVADRPNADVVVELRSGALSIDEDETLIGIPQIDLPIPLAGTLGLPEVALFKRDERKGVAKFAASAYDAKGGQLTDTSAPEYGFAEETKWVFLLFFSWTTSDVVPEEAVEE